MKVVVTKRDLITFLQDESLDIFNGLRASVKDYKLKIDKSCCKQKKLAKQQYDNIIISRFYNEFEDRVEDLSFLHEYLAKYYRVKVDSAVINIPVRVDGKIISTKRIEL